jgi:hypothetical protein
VISTKLLNNLSLWRVLEESIIAIKGELFCGNTAEKSMHGEH